MKDPKYKVGDTLVRNNDRDQIPVDILEVLVTVDSDFEYRIAPIIPVYINVDVFKESELDELYTKIEL